MSRILIVDDEIAIRNMLEKFFTTKGYECTAAADAFEARTRMEEQDFEVILCDINMPGGSGLEVIREIIQKGRETAPIMITGVDDPLVVNKSFQIGAFDYITKPLDLNRVLISVTNALHRRELEIINRKYRHELEKKVEERTAKLREASDRLEKMLDGVVDTIAFTLEKRDPYTSGHQRRVAQLACGIAKKMKLPEEQIYGLQMASFIHDIGKIYVPSEILTKPGKLSEVEFGIIKTHPTVGYEILQRIEFPWPIAEIAYQHHERANGSGYPRGLSGKEILLEARILGVADVVEAMASHRPYRPALGLEKAMEEISRNMGVLYETDVAQACLDLLKNDGFRLE